MTFALLPEFLTTTLREPAILCSVVEWKGSVPRKDYPLMLVLPDGSIRGTIGGGSMELEIIRSARDMLQKPVSPRLFDFDMTGKDVAGDLGLCGGTLKILAEPFSETLQSFYRQLVKALKTQADVPEFAHLDMDLEAYLSDPYQYLNALWQEFSYKEARKQA